MGFNDINLQVSGPQQPASIYKTKVLKGQVPFATQVTEPNTKYVIKHNFVLDGDVTIPENCILEFDGGSIGNSGNNTCKLYGNNASINLVNYQIFNNIEPINFQFPYLNPKWFGAKGDYDEQLKTGTDDSSVFDFIFKLTKNYYNGIAIYLIGHYLINTAITVESDVNIVGTHCNSRNFGGPSYNSDNSSPSLIAVGADVTAFTVLGYPGSNPNDYKQSNIYLDHIKVVGVDDTTSIFMDYQAAGAPSRVSVIRDIEATSLKKVINITGTETTIIGNLTISCCNVYRCGQFITAVGSNTVFTTCNLIIENSTIEQNSAKSIDIRDAFSSIIISNNILEGQPEPIYITFRGRGDIEINSNYFEANNTGEQTIFISLGNTDNYCYIHNNYMSEPILVNILNGKVLCTDLYQFDTNSILQNVEMMEGCDLANFKKAWIKDCCYFPFEIGECENIDYPFTGITQNGLIGHKGAGSTNMYMSVSVTDATQRYYVAFYCDKNQISGGMYIAGQGGITSTYYPKKDKVGIAAMKPYGVGSNRISFNVPTANNICGVRLIENDSDILALKVPSKYNMVRVRTAYRPSYSNIPIGARCFDLTLNKPIYWNGTAWVDATGATV